MSLELGLTIGGILLTVVTFLIGYRRTIGALNERIRIANDTLVTSLEKHLSLSNAPVTDRHIQSLRSGQAYISGVDIERIISINLLRDVVATKIFQNEYLTFDEKDRSYKALGKSFEARGEFIRVRPPLSLSNIIPRIVAGIYDGISSTTAVLGFLSVLVSALAATVVAGLGLDGVSVGQLRDMALPLGVAIAGTGTVLVLLAELKRRSSRQAAVGRVGGSTSSRMFNNIYDAITEIEGCEAPIEEVDFYFTNRDGDKIGVEVRGYPIVDVDDFISRLNKGLDKFGLEKVIVLASKDVSEELGKQVLPAWLSVMSESEGVELFHAESRASSD